MTPRSLIVGAACIVLTTAFFVWARVGDPPVSRVGQAPAAPVATGPARPVELTATAHTTRERAQVPSENVVAEMRAPSAMRAGFEVRGRLVAADGAGVPDIGCAVESLYSKSADGAYETHGTQEQPLARGRSGPDGSFVIALTRPADREVKSLFFACRASGYASISRGIAESQIAPVVELGDLVLLPGATIAGFVRDSDRLAIADARVDVALSTGENRWTGTHVSSKSNRDGSFRLDGVTDGLLRLTATTPDSRSSEPSELTIHPGENRAGIALELPSYTDPFAISGVVHDVDGSPLPEAPLMWVTLTGSTSNMNTTTADRNGAFRIQGSEGTVFRVSASHPRGEARAVSRRDITPGTHGIELRLTPLVTIPLRVRRPDGAFVPEYSYLVRVQMTTAYGSMTTGSKLVNCTPGPSGVTALPLPADTFAVDVQAVGYTSESTSWFEPDDLSLSIDVVLRPLPELRGRVVRGRDPVVGARVRAHAAFDHGASATHDVFDLVASQCDPCTEVTTGSDGTFVLRLTREGRWHARVAADGHPSIMSGAVDLASGGAVADVLVDLGLRGAITGHVRDARGAVLARRTVAASSGDGDPVQVVTDADGAYTVEPVAPGPWQVRVLDPQRPNPGGSSTRDGDDEAPPITWDCRVMDGSVTRHDLVVADP